MGVTRPAFIGKINIAVQQNAETQLFPSLTLYK